MLVWPRCEGYRFGSYAVSTTVWQVMWLCTLILPRTNSRNNLKKMSLNSTLKDDYTWTFIASSSTPVWCDQERSMIVPEAHLYECNKIIPQLLRRIQKFETLVTFLVSARVTKIDSNREHSQLASNEIIIDSEGFSVRLLWRTWRLLKCFKSFATRPQWPRSCSVQHQMPNPIKQRATPSPAMELPQIKHC